MGNESSSSVTPSTPSSVPGKRSLTPQYTLRVLVQGDKCTGKTSVVRLLRGDSAFCESYEPSSSISALSLDWCFKSTSEQVRCELWDVVESAPQPRKPVSSELKLAISSTSSGSKRGSVTLAELDAQSFDVYRGAHAVLLVYDPAKRWTFDMCKTMLMSTIPPHLDVLLLANFRDRPPISGTVSMEEGRALAQQRKDTRFLECSCKDGFGKTQILSFLNVPFLKMQKAYLESLLTRNAEDLQLATEEFDLISFEIDYSSYLTWVKAQPEGRLSAHVVSAATSGGTSGGGGGGGGVALASPSARASSPATVKSPAKSGPAPIVAPKPPVHAAALVPIEPAADDENLDDFLTKVKTDGWGETIESDDDSSSGNEQFKPKKKEPIKPSKVVVEKPKAAVVEKLEAVVEKPQAAEPVAKIVGQQKVTEKIAEKPKVIAEKPKVIEEDIVDDAPKKFDSDKEDSGWGETLPSSDDEEDVNAGKIIAAKVVETKAAEAPKQEANPAIAAALEAARRLAEEQAAAVALKKAEAQPTEVKKKKKKAATGKKKSSKSSAAPAAAPKRSDYDAL